MPYHPVTKELISERMSRKLRLIREQKIKSIIAQRRNPNAVSEWLANEEILSLEEEILDLGGFITEDNKVTPNIRPTQPPLVDKLRLNYDKIALWTGLLSFSALMWFFIIKLLKGAFNG